MKTKVVITVVALFIIVYVYLSYYSDDATDDATPYTPEELEVRNKVPEMVFNQVNRMNMRNWLESGDPGANQWLVDKYNQFYADTNNLFKPVTDISQIPGDEIQKLVDWVKSETPGAVYNPMTFGKGQVGGVPIQLVLDRWNTIQVEKLNIPKVTSVLQIPIEIQPKIINGILDEHTASNRANMVYERAPLSTIAKAGLQAGVWPKVTTLPKFA